MADDLEGKVFVFDWAASYLDGGIGFTVMQVEDGRLVEKFHPEVAPGGEMVHHDVDRRAIRYLRQNDICEVYTPSHLVESPKRFLDAELWYREELTDPDLVPGQWFFYQRLPVEHDRKELLEKSGIKVNVIDPTLYITCQGPEPAPEDVPEPAQLCFSFYER